VDQSLVKATKVVVVNVVFVCRCDEKKTCVVDTQKVFLSSSSSSSSSSFDLTFFIILSNFLSHSLFGVLFFFFFFLFEIYFIISHLGPNHPL
tara:strand:+ start:3898 stop:4173 length:276 start_codon:yes stop_codon:yes gene_type:complete